MARLNVETEFERRAILAALSFLCDPLRTMENLKIGDTVQLKSGGPIMTVRNVDGEYVTCDWFDGSGPHHKQFRPAQLKEAEPKEDGPFIA